MRVRFETLPLEQIDLNEGQVDGLNKNPREWTFDDVERLKRSIQQTPELLEARGIIVFPYDFRYVAIGGNMRLTALRSMGAEAAPCIVLPEDTTLEELEQVAIKDNGEFGRWDKDKLKAEWEDCPFADWGIDVFKYDEANEQQKEEKQKPESDGKAELKIMLSAFEFEFVNCSLREIDPDDSSQAFLQVMGYYGTEQ